MIFYNIKNRAFTLVELVIIVVIIGILVTIGFLNFSSQRQLAKDTVRAQDLKTISNLLDLAYAKKGGFPEPSAERMEGGQLKLETIDGKDFKTGTFGGTDIINLYGEEASKIPKDPKDKETEYFYSLSTDGRFYLLRAQLEDNRTYALANYMTSQGTDILALNTGTGTSLPGQQTPPGSGGGNQGGGNQGGGNQGGGNPPGNNTLPPIPEPPSNTTPISCFQVRKESTKTVIRGYTCTDQDVVIPNTIFGSPVKEIAVNTFKGKNLRSVISHSVEVIGDSAFQANQLEYIYFPAAIKVGNNSFQNNPDLTSVSLERVTHIGDSAFGSGFFKKCLPQGYYTYGDICTPGNLSPCNPDVDFSNCTTLLNNVEEINLPSVEEIGQSAFLNSKIQIVNLPKIKKIGNEAFYSRTPYLKEINLNTSTDIDIIGSSAFGRKYDNYGTKPIIKINTLKKVKELGSSVFWGFSLEGDVNNLENLVKIGSSAFLGTGIQGIVNMPNVEIIGTSAFNNNPGITEVFFPKVKEIHGGAFYKTGITKVTLPNTLTTFQLSTPYYAYNIYGTFYESPVQTVINQSSIPNNTVKGAFDSNPTITN